MEAIFDEESNEALETENLQAEQRYATQLLRNAFLEDSFKRTS